VVDKEMTMKKAEVSATWDISLNCYCPKCGEFVDLLREDNFWEHHEWLQPIENGTERANNLKVICPECSNEFKVCCEY
jgi:Zn finger protein HypA/HybF involved in hydrogenase expression